MLTTDAVLHAMPDGWRMGKTEGYFILIAPSNSVMVRDASLSRFLVMVDEKYAEAWEKQNKLEREVERLENQITQIKGELRRDYYSTMAPDYDE